MQALQNRPSGNIELDYITFFKVRFRSRTFRLYWVGRNHFQSKRILWPWRMIGEILKASISSFREIVEVNKEFESYVDLLCHKIDCHYITCHHHHHHCQHHHHHPHQHLPWPPPARISGPSLCISSCQGITGLPTTSSSPPPASPTLDNVPNYVDSSVSP